MPKNEAILNLKKMQEKDKNKEESDEDKHKLEKDLLAVRKRKQGLIYPQQTGPRSQGEEGLIGKAKHLAGLTAEGVAAEMLTIMFIDLFLLLIQAEYRLEIKEFQAAKEKGIAYEVDPQTGKWPTIYSVNPDGTLDFDSPYQEGEEISRTVIRANGYVPEPDYKECLKIHLASYMESMHGFNKLPPELKQALYKSHEVILKEADAKEHAEKQTRQDVTARNMMQRKK